MNLLRWICSQGTRFQDAEDILQDLLIELLKSNVPPEEARRFLWWRVRRRRIDRWRQRTRSREEPLSNHEEWLEAADMSLEQMSDDDLLNKLEQRLSESDREILRLKLLGFSEPEIVEELNLPGRHTVANAMRRIRDIGGSL